MVTVMGLKRAKFRCLCNAKGHTTVVYYKPSRRR